MSAFERTAAMVLAVVLLLVAPAGAWAHGIGLEAQDKSVIEFVPIGMEQTLARGADPSALRSASSSLSV